MTSLTYPDQESGGLELLSFKADSSRMLHNCEISGHGLWTLNAISF